MSAASPYDVIGEMEGTIDDCRSMCSALAIIAEDLRNDAGQHSRGIYGIVAGLEARLAAAEEARQVVWRALHPCRERFESEGWPKDKAASEGAA